MKYFHVIFWFCCAAFLLESTTGWAQNRPNATQTVPNPLTSGTIDSQFFHLNRISRTQEGFKLVRPHNLDLIRKNVLDSLRSQRTKISSQSEEILTLNAQVSQLKDSLTSVQAKMMEVKNQVDSISFFGADLKKGTYHLFVWTIIAVLLLIFVFSALRFRRGNAAAREARETLAQIQEEYGQHRKKALEREQKLKRQLQDEINKRHQ